MCSTGLGPVEHIPYAQTFFSLEDAMSGRKFIIPEFGPLSGMRVIGAGSLIAMPFAASMLAEFARRSYR